MLGLIETKTHAPRAKNQVQRTKNRSPMKHCPTCNRSFVDESLGYCTDDGTVLLPDASPESTDAQATRMFSDPPPTAFMPSPPETSYGLGDSSSSSSASQPFSNPLPPPNENAAPEPYRWASEAPPAVWTPPPAPAYPIPQQPQQNLAILSLVFGIAGITFGWICGGLILGLVALILGFVALSQIKNNPSRYGGKPMAIGGMVTGGIVLLIHLALVAFSIIMLAIGSMR